MHHFLKIASILFTFLTVMPSYGQLEFSKMSAKQRIAIADKEQVEAATDATFQNHMQLGHDLFREKHYLKAIRAYESAQSKRPYNVYPKVKISDIEMSMKDTLAVLRKAEAEQQPNMRQKEEAQAPPKTDMVDESKEERMQRLNEWEQNERSRREKEREKAEKAPEQVSQQGGDVVKLSLEDYQKELAEKYPSGITEEQLTEGNKTVIRRIVVREGKGDEYRRVEHNWGGVFYFKNGEAVTDRVWKAETEK